MTAIKPLRTPADAERAIALSREKTVVIYKHSPICSISETAIEEFEAFAGNLDGSAELFSIDVLDARPASMKIEELTGVRHESPQALILDGGKCVWHASHRRVLARDLQAQTAALEK